jgi:nucleotide-binding universal stress UspA family protein
MEAFHPKRILCPTDFSEPATLALQYGKELSRCFEADLLVLYAEPFVPPPYFTARQMGKLTKEAERSKKMALKSLKAYVQKRLGDSVKSETIVMEDQPVPSILKAAKQRGVGLIVMGTYGHSGFNRFVLGSVTERILHEADCPVLTVRLKKGETDPQATSIKRILCPVNMTEVAYLALEHAVSIAECFRADLQVLHVIERDMVEAEERDETDRLCQWIPQSIRSRCSLKEFVEKGDAAERIIAVAAAQACDMIILGAQHKLFVDTTIIGTTTTRVTRYAPCPVLTVVRQSG